MAGLLRELHYNPPRPLAQWLEQATHNRLWALVQVQQGPPNFGLESYN